MDYYLRNVVPSQLIAERGSSLVIINPGSANIRIGFANQKVPFTVPHCIARHVQPQSDGTKRTLCDQMLNTQVTAVQNSEREQAYDIVASLLKIPFLDEERTNKPLPMKMGRVDGYSSQQSKSDVAFTWTNVMEEKLIEKSDESPSEMDDIEGASSPINAPSVGEVRLKEIIFGEDALKIPPSEPYCLHRPIRRGHFNVSQYYSFQQVCDDVYTIWDWILSEKLHIQAKDRNLYSALIVLPETFDNREIKEILTIVLQDLKFSTAVVHQEGLAAAFGNGLSTACVVNIGAQVTTVVCIEDGVALPSSTLILPYGGEDISRCLLWVQRRLRTWPSISTNPLKKPMDMLMLNKLKETYCLIRDGELDAAAVVHSYDNDKSVGSHKARLSSVSVPPMGLFYPKLFVHEEYPPPPQPWFQDYEDMLDDSWQTDYPRRPDTADALYSSGNTGYSMWENYPSYPTRQKKYDNIGLAEAIVDSILSAGRIDLQRKLFCSIQLIGGAASTPGLVAAAEERVFHAIPSNEAIDTVEVLQSRSEPMYVSWKGGAIVGVLDFAREAWIHREDWIKNGIHVGAGRKYRDSYFLQAQAMCYYNS